MSPLRPRSASARPALAALGRLLAAPRVVTLVGIALACGATDPGPGASVARSNIVLVTLDTTRADHLGVYGYERPTTPNLDALARHSVVYDRAYSTSSWTLPAHASLFTGRYPSSHGARHDPEGELLLASALRTAPAGIRARGMGAEETTLATTLADAGYRTGGVVAGPWLLRAFGLSQGFEHWDDRRIKTSAGRRAADVTTSALEWLDAAGDPEQRFFLFLNYFDPHAPYAPPAAHARTFLPPGVEPEPRALGQAVDLYDAEILYMDAELGRLLRGLEERGLYEDTLVVVTGDHGELFGDHGSWGHERFLWEPLVRVPLLVKPAGPPGPSRRLDEPVSVVDVLPMILEALGLPIPANVQGGPPPTPRRPLLAEVNPIQAGSTPPWRARWEGDRKLLESADGTALLFDVVRDPGETTDLADESAAELARVRAALARDFAALPPAGAPAAPMAVDPETLEALRALGYVPGDEEPEPPSGEASPTREPGAELPRDGPDAAPAEPGP